MATEVTNVPNVPEARREYLRFSGNATDYFRIWIVNVLLTVLTLGVYSAWAKVRRNRYIYGHTSLRDGRFDYHAAPVAILRGRFIAVVLLLSVLAVQVYVPKYTMLVATLVAVAIPWLIVRSRMFTMRNTSYRNIRFGFIPAYWESFQTVFFAGVLTFGTFGIGTPMAHFLRNRFVVNFTRYGNLRFTMQAAVWDFFTAYLLAFVASSIIVIPLLQSAFGLLGGLPVPAGEYNQYLNIVLPIVSALAAYYIAAKFLLAATMRPTLAGSSVVSPDNGAARFQLGCDWNLNRLLLMYVTNFIAIICSLGLLIPWAQLRVTRYLVDGAWVEFQGSLDDVISLQSQEVSSVGEEVGSAFDVDIGL